VRSCGFRLGSDGQRLGEVQAEYAGFGAIAAFSPRRAIALSAEPSSRVVGLSQLNQGGLSR